MISLSTCWNSRHHTDGRAIVREACELGFDWIEVSHGTNVSLVQGVLEAFNAGEIKISSLHNFCPAPVEVMMDAPDVYEFTSPIQWQRERAISLTRKTIEMAGCFGTDRVVIHLGCVPMKSITDRLEAMTLAGALYSGDYCDLKLKLVTQREKENKIPLDRIRAALTALLPDCEKHGVRLGIETRSHYEQIPNQSEMLMLMDEYRDCPWIGAWHDFGHVQRQANLALLDHELYLSQIAPRLIGCHVHDVQWPARDHRAPLSTGGVDLKRLLTLVPAHVPLIWEISPSQKHEKVAAAKVMWEQTFGSNL